MIRVGYGGTKLCDLLVSERKNLLLEQAETLAERLLRESGGFAIWGAGNTGMYTQRFLEEYSGGRLLPRCVVDNNPSLWGRNGIVSPEEFFETKDCPKHLVIAVYVADQVVEQVRRSGYAGEVSCLNAAALYTQEDIWTFYEDHLTQLEATYRLLAEERSKETLVGFLNYIRTLDDGYLKAVNGDSREKLMDPSLLRLTKQEHFVDVGAFTGDTIGAFLRNTGGVYHDILAFEPDQENHAALCHYVRESGLKRVTLKRMAAGKTDGTLHFRAGMSESCRLEEGGSGAVHVCRLDRLPEAERTTVLKVSANGAELDVLAGAEGLIRRNRPKISAYASGALLWEIPAYLKSLAPDYQIYYRHYGFGRQAMICYAAL